METGNPWADYLAAAVPPDYRPFILRHILHPNAPIHVLKRTLLSYAHRTYTAMLPLLEPLVDRTVVALHDSPGVVVLAFVLILLYLAVQVLNWMRRVVLFWTRLILNIATFAVVVALASVAWQRGLEQSGRDVVVIGGKVIGYAAALKDVWLSEYQRFDAQANGGSR